MLSLEGGVMIFGRGVVKKGFIEWEMMIINVFRKLIFCRVCYKFVKVMGLNIWVKFIVVFMLLFLVFFIGC